MLNLRGFLAAAVLFTSLQTALASPVAAPEGNIDARQSDGSFYPITGVTTGGNAPRLEIRDVEADSKYLQLYVQSLEKMMAAGQDEKLSYYAVAGIHSRPYREWDGGSIQGGPRTGGYCPHSSNLFAPWHRPYMALMEQILQGYAADIASSFTTDTAAWQATATRFRLPYWDWSAPHSPFLPPSTTMRMFTVQRPNGTSESILNPLFLYKFHPISAQQMGENEYGHWPVTKRAAKSSAPQAPSQNGAVETTLDRSFQSLKSRIYNLFSQRGVRFNDFSSNAGRGRDNLESIHGVIHASFLHGHMNPVDYSGFDPIFYLHHSNVDRLIAIWQKLYPATYVEDAVASGNTWTIRQGSTQGPNSPLTPFHRDTQGTYWTSNSVRNINVFHYTYPELADNPTIATLRQRINALYGPNATGLSANQSRQSFTQQSTQSSNGTTNGTITTDSSNNGTANETQTRNQGGSSTSTDRLIVRDHIKGYETKAKREPRKVYTAEVTAPLRGLGGTYSVALYMGQPGPHSDSTGYLADPNLIAQHGIFAPLGGGMRDTMIPARFDLTQFLSERHTAGALRSLDEKPVINFIQQNVRWAVLQGDSRVDGSQLPGIKVSLAVANAMARPNDEEFPTVEEAEGICHLEEA